MLAESWILEDLEGTRGCLLRRIDEEATLSILDLQRNPPYIAADRRACLPKCLRDGQPEALASRLLQDHVGLRLERIDLDRADVVEVIQDLDVGVAGSVLV